MKDSVHQTVDTSSTIRDGEPSQPTKLSFRDKLVGGISGAFSQAFAFSDHMEADSDSDEEIEKVKEGFASVNLSKETKKSI